MDTQTNLTHMVKVYPLIDEQNSFDAMSLRLQQEPKIAIDIEADSMYHFKEKICLIQLATSTEIYIIDPLAISDMEPLKPIFANPSILKVFHGGDYDIRSLYRDFQIQVNPLFDTELASRFCGIRESGLSSVLKKFFNIHLDKTFQKKDWSKRPLLDTMIDYAIKDVAYLLPLADILLKKLDTAERMDWIQEECDLLSKSRPAVKTDQPLFLKCKGIGKLSPQHLYVFEELLKYRMQLGEMKDRPVFKVMSNETLLDIAIKLPKSKRALEIIGSLSPKQLKMYGKSILEIVKQSSTIEHKDIPQYPKRSYEPDTPDLTKRMNYLKQWRDIQSKMLNIDASLILNRAQMHEISYHNPMDEVTLGQLNVLRQWQMRHFGQQILQALTGKY
ncbi:MAG: ribonuclease D [Desulfobacterales bacterium]|nr:ribonuclease D [Desulfobacterales bacterium]